MTHMLVIYIMILVLQAYNIDGNIGTEFLRNLIAKEIMKVKVTYVENEETQEQIRSGEEKEYI